MSNDAVQLFQRQSTALGATVEASVARATQEVQAALVVAKKFPRNEFDAYEKIMQACKRKSLAEVAEYEFSRGGTKIVGPTIDLLKAIAKRWGNITYGWTETDRREGESTVHAYAWDQESNARSEISFVVRHWRDTKQGGYALTDERDIYELLANQAARRVRACLESVIDADVVEGAVQECRKTMASGNKEPLADRVRSMVSAFGDHFQVTSEMLEAKLGNKLSAISENQLASLRRIYKSLKDGVGKREDFFKSDIKPEFPGAKTSAPDPTDDVPYGDPPKDFLNTLTGLLKLSKVSEADVLQWMRDTGKAEETLTTLAQVQEMQPSAIQFAHDNWADIEKTIKAAKGASK